LIFSVCLQFKQLMLKFDPDDPDDDEPNGAPPKVTIKLGGDDVRPSQPSDGAGIRNVPDKSRQNTQHEQQKVKTEFVILHMTLFIVNPLSGSSCLLGLQFFCFQRTG
jgi:hypothetical protein